MQVAAENPIRKTEMQRPPQVVITVETIAIALLVVLSLLVRVAELDTVPISLDEVPNALSAYQSLPGAEFPQMQDRAAVSDSPIVFWAQRITYSLFGHGESSSRLLTAIAGALVAMLPLLFRDVLGPARAFLFALVLTFSPTLFLVSRAASGTIWALLLAGIGLRILWWYAQRRDGKVDASGYAVAATGVFGTLILLTGPTGPLLMLVLLLAAVVAIILTALDRAFDDDDKGESPESPFTLLMRGVVAWPWGSGVVAVLLSTFIVSTGFLLYPAGLSSVGAGLEGFLRGFVDAEAGRVLFLPLTLTVFYEPLVWVFALVGLAMLMRRQSFDLVERFLIAWAGFAVLAGLLYRGAGPDVALFLIVPLVGLASYAFADAFNNDDLPVLWSDEFLDSAARERTALPGKIALAVLMFVLLIAFTMHLHMVVRGVIRTPEGSLGTFIGFLDDQAFANVFISLIWLLITFLFMLVGYFLAGSVWGSVLPLRAGTIGGLAFLLLVGGATSWTTAITNATNPVELWQNEVVTREAYKLRETLVDIATRETGGFLRVEVRAETESDSVLAWLLRDFTNVTLIEDAGAAQLAPVALLRPTNDGVPDLGAAYVGQEFVLTRSWNSGNGLVGWDFLPWWVVREVRFSPFDSQRITLWVRQDIYDSEPIAQ